MKIRRGPLSSLLVAFIVMLTTLAAPASAAGLPDPAFERVAGDATPATAQSAAGAGAGETLRAVGRDSAPALSADYRRDTALRASGTGAPAASVEASIVPNELIIEVDRATNAVLPSGYRILDRISFGQTEFVKVRAPEIAAASAVHTLQNLPGVKSVQPSSPENVLCQPSAVGC